MGLEKARRLKKRFFKLRLAGEKKKKKIKKKQTQGGNKFSSLAMAKEGITRTDFKGKKTRKPPKNRDQGRT